MNSARLVLDMSEHDYHADPSDTPSLSVSVAKVLLEKSPYHAWLEHPRLGGNSRAATDGMDLGSLSHKMLLGKGASIHVVDADDWRTKAAQVERDYYRRAGMVVVLRKQADEAPAIADQWSKNLLEHHGITIPKITEATALWESFGVHCRCRFDAIDPETLTIYDIKRTQTAHTKPALERHFASMGYHVQVAGYTEGAERTHYETAGRWKFVFLVLEPNPPYCATPVHVDGTFRELGSLQWARAQRTWGQCINTNTWPPPQPVTVSAKSWAITEEAEKTYVTDL